MVLDDMFVSKGVKVVGGVDILGIVGNVVVGNSESNDKVCEKKNSKGLGIVGVLI